MNTRHLLAALSLLPSLTLAADISGDEAAVRQALMNTWDKPDNPLVVTPVVIAGDYAIADWLQGTRGGRALLARRHGHWQGLICGGDGLRNAAQLQGMGVPAQTSQALAEGLQQVEAVMPEAQRRQLSGFGQPVPMAGGHRQH